MNQKYEIPIGLDQPQKSGQNLVKSGLFLFCVSLCLCVNAITIGFITDEWTSPSLTLCCSLIFFTVSLLSMYGEDGQNDRKKKILRTCIVITLLGLIATIVGIVYNVDSWKKFHSFCSEKKENLTLFEFKEDNAFNSTFDDGDNFQDAAMMNQDNVTVSQFNVEVNYTSEEDFKPKDLYGDDVRNETRGNLTSNVTNSSQFLNTVDKSDWYCSKGHLFLLLVGLMICNQIFSFGLCYVIFVTRFKGSGYAKAVVV